MVLVKIDKEKLKTRQTKIAKKISDSMAKQVKAEFIEAHKRGFWRRRGRKASPEFTERARFLVTVSDGGLSYKIKYIPYKKG